MSIFTPSTALYQDVLDYLDRRGIPSIAGIFDDYNQSTNPYVINFDEESESNITEPRRMPMLPIQIEGPGDGPRGIGLFGNLEPGSKRTVLVNGVPTEVYKNITTGLLQTFDGKNVKGDVTETGAYDYEFEASKGEGLNPMNVGGISAFSRTGRVDTANKQGAVDKAAREAEKKRKAEEAARKAQEEARRKSLEEAAKKEQARRDAVERMRQQNEREGRGGYQSDFAQDRDFMDGGDRGRGMGAEDKGGSSSMGSF